MREVEQSVAFPLPLSGFDKVQLLLSSFKILAFFEPRIQAASETHCAVPGSTHEGFGLLNSEVWLQDFLEFVCDGGSGGWGREGGLLRRPGAGSCVYSFVVILSVRAGKRMLA